MALAPSRNHPINCGDFDQSKPQRVFAKDTISARRFEVSAIPQARAVGEQTDVGPVTVSSFGAVVNRRITAAAVDDLVVRVTPTGAGEFGEVVVESKTPLVASGTASFPANSSGEVVFPYGSNGVAVISALSAVGYERLAVATVGTSGSQNIDAWIDYTSNSLGKHLESQVPPASGSMDIFSSMSHDTSQYTRNPDFWLNNVDVTCFSPWNSRGGQQRAGTLVSPQFILCATHFPLFPGDTVRFVTASGAVVNRTIVDSRNSAFDVIVAKLNAPVSTGITPCKVVPPGGTNSGLLRGAYKWLPNSSWFSLYQGRLAGVIALANDARPFPPAIMCNQDKKCGLAATTGMDSGWLGGSLSPSQYQGISGRIFYPELDVQALVRQGCSGSPVFFLINGELCLIGMLYYANSTAASFTSQRTHDLVQDAMDEMGSDGNDTLSPADLSAFTDFSS